MLLSTPRCSKRGRAGLLSGHVCRHCGCGANVCALSVEAVGGHGNIQGCSCGAGRVPKYGGSALGILGSCWDVFRGVLWECTEIQVGGQILEHTGKCGGVTEIYWSIPGG